MHNHLLIKLLLSTNQAYTTNPSDNSHANDKFIRPNILQRFQNDSSNSQLLP